MESQIVETVFKILEQTIDDSEVSGLILEFQRCKLGEYLLTTQGDMPFGNRDLFFNTRGEFTGSGTAIRNVEKAFKDT